LLSSFLLSVILFIITKREVNNMGALIKLILVLYLFSLLFSMFVALLRFLIDVAKWHDKEKKVKITASNSLESEVFEYERTGSNTGTGERTGTGDTTGSSDFSERTNCDIQPIKF
jgi:hypothetical protein